MADLDEKIAAIRAGLSGVTPGPWLARGITVVCNAKAQIAKINWRLYGECGEVDATRKHIARLDPNTVQEILDRLDKVTRERDEARAEAERWREEQGCACSGDDQCRFARERDEARARIAALETALRPFADAISGPEYHEYTASDDWWGPQLRVQEYRRARAALNVEPHND